MFNVSQLYSIPQFLRTNFQGVNYNERAFITIKEKKKRSVILRSRFLQDIIGKIKTSSNKSWPKHQRKIPCFRYNTTETFIFMSSYRIRKFHIYARIRICGKILLSYIFVWRKAQKIWYSVKWKHTKTNEKMIFSLLFTNFRETEILFLIQRYQ